MAERYDLVIVGMGSGGIAAARFAATLGVRVAAVERHRIGGDCLWTGCVPSKALLASAKVAHHMRTADRYGVGAVEPQVDTAAVFGRIRAIQQGIAGAEDSPEALEALGVEVVLGEARIAGPHLVEAAGRQLPTRFVLLCTGSRPTVPPVAGLEAAGFLSSESVFELERAPESLVVIGGGPIGVELAQGLRRLGVEVTLLQSRDRLLERDEPELVAALTTVLRQEGVNVVLDVAAERVAVENGRKVVHGTAAGRPARWEAAELLVAAGRTPNLDGLGLERAGVAVGPRGVQVDERLRSSVRSIYAAGDVAGRFLFTHSAAFDATIAVRNMFFPGGSSGACLVPWCTFTDPELAHVGLTSAQAVERHGARKVALHRSPLAHSDRARADGATDGAILIVTADGKVVGAHALAPAAGELIHELALAVSRKLRLTDLAGLVHVYPTLAWSVNVLAGEATYEQARRYGWLARRRR
jgi:pyruvate/2-oxoglutarate dehydrogenase complex dihydrolipoamide dehydrogenase (E3) component